MDTSTFTGCFSRFLYTKMLFQWFSWTNSYTFLLDWHNVRLEHFHFVIQLLAKLTSHSAPWRMPREKCEEYFRLLLRKARERVQESIQEYYFGTWCILSLVTFQKTAINVNSHCATIEIEAKRSAHRHTQKNGKQNSNGIWHTQWHKYNSDVIIVRLCPDIISTMRHQQQH